MRKRSCHRGRLIGILATVIHVSMVAMLGPKYHIPPGVKYSRAQIEEKDRAFMEHRLQMARFQVQQAQVDWHPHLR